MPPNSRGLIGLFRPRSCSLAIAASRSHATIATITSTSDLLPPPGPKKIQLRRYQEECIQAVLSSLKEGHKRLGISLATGSGKTVIFTHLIDRIEPHTTAASQTLILAHRQELVEQAARHCSDIYPTKSVEIEMGRLHSTGLADITVASVQSIISGSRLDKFDPSRFKLVLVDEAHHIVAPGYLKTLDHFGLSTANPSSPALVGVSATLSRFDGLKIGAALDQIVFHKDLIAMIEDKWLSPMCATTVQSKADISAVKNGANGDFQSSSLSRVVNTDIINDITVRTWFAKAKDRKSTLVFCCDIAHVEGLTNQFRKFGVDARFVTGKTPNTQRSALLDAFRNCEFPVLVNCSVYTEGTDVPNIDCVLLARPTKSQNLLVQMVGRGMRLHPGKTDCHVIDMVASLNTGLVTTPTLFGLDPDEVLEESSIEDIQAIVGKREAIAKDLNKLHTIPGATVKSVTFTDYDTVFDLLEDTTGDRHIRTLSPHNWVCVSQDRYILSHSDGSYLKIDRSEYEPELFTVTEYVKMSSVAKGRAPYMPPRSLADNVPFVHAVNAADTYAKTKYPLYVINKHMAWRRLPATDGQLMFLNKLRLKNDQLVPGDITKGQAGDMITKVKHGARGRFASLDTGKKKAEKHALKLEQLKVMREREKVSVGPLMS